MEETEYDYTTAPVLAEASPTEAGTGNRDVALILTRCSGFDTISNSLIPDGGRAPKEFKLERADMAVLFRPLSGTAPQHVAK